MRRWLCLRALRETRIKWRFSVCAQARLESGRTAECSEAADIDHRQVVRRRVDRVTVVMELNELVPTGRRPSCRRERWWLGGLAEIREDLPDRRRVGDEGDEANVATAGGARERKLFRDPRDELGLSRREVSWARLWASGAPSPRPSPGGRGGEDAVWPRLLRFPMASAVTAGRSG